MSLPRRNQPAMCGLNMSLTFVAIQKQDAELSCLCKGLKCQASSELASSALQQLANPLVRDCCATVAATAGALMLVKLAEILAYKGIIDQVPATTAFQSSNTARLGCDMESSLICGTPNLVLGYSGVNKLLCAEAEQETCTHPCWSRLRTVLALVQVMLCSLPCIVHQTPSHLMLLCISLSTRCSCGASANLAIGCEVAC